MWAHRINSCSLQHFVIFLPVRTELQVFSSNKCYVFLGSFCWALVAVYCRGEWMGVSAGNRGVALPQVRQEVVCVQLSDR